MRGGADVSAAVIIPYIAGMAAAFASGMAAIIVLRMIAKRRNFWVFGVYCALIGALAVVFG
jgi:undecaprenyl pyrophosphate phosphatase UppP